MITVRECEHGLRFADGDASAGEYVLDDPFKPYVHPLRTPRGNVLTRVSPFDHRHHKGLMYALLCPDLNFWEEAPGEAHCGVQHIRSTTINNDGASITQRLHWANESGDLPAYDELRTISLARRGEEAFVWTWRSQRTALRDHHVMKSQWSMQAEDGRLINYHGLGIRLPRSFAHPNERCRGAVVDGEACTPPSAAHGTKAGSVKFWGAFDGKWTPEKGGVTFEQPYGFTNFVVDHPFPYLAVGPSNEQPYDVSEGATFDETYTVIVEDRNE